MCGAVGTLKLLSRTLDSGCIRWLVALVCGAVIPDRSALACVNRGRFAPKEDHREREARQCLGIIEYHEIDLECINS